MKPPMRSDAGPEAWVLYDPQIARKNFQEYCIKNNLLEHLPFLLNPEPKSSALVVLVNKSKDLSIIPKSQVTSSVATIPDVSKRPKKKRRNKMTKKIEGAKAPEAASAPKEVTSSAAEAVRHPKAKPKKFSISENFKVSGLLVVIVALLLWNGWNIYNRCNNCDSKPAVIVDNKPQATAQQTPKPKATEQPIAAVPKPEAKSQKEIVLYNTSFEATHVVEYYPIGEQHVVGSLNDRGNMVVTMIPRSKVTIAILPNAKPKVDGNCISVQFGTKDSISYDVHKLVRM